MIINVAVILAGLFMGSVADLKSREIPDILNFSMVFMGISIGVASSIFFGNVFLALNALAGLIAGIIIGDLFYYTGQWGGGDAKMMRGIGALMGLSIPTLFSEFHLFFVFIINSFLVGAVYGVLWMFYLMFRHWKEFRKEFNIKRHEKSSILIRKIFLVSSLIIIIAVFAMNIDFLVKSVVFIFLLAIILFFYMSIIIRAVEKTCMIKKIPVSKLTEGDWISEPVKIKGKTYKGSKTGITIKDIKMLKANNIKTVVVREGIPFVPSFLITYIFTISVGNWLLYLF